MQCMFVPKSHHPKLHTTLPWDPLRSCPLPSDDEDGGIFECFECGGEAIIYAAGEVVCLDPSSVNYVCSPGVQGTQVTVEGKKLVYSEMLLCRTWKIVGTATYSVTDHDI